jgi:hypothetical protein
MPLPNRVQPTGELLAHPARGMFMGNRGRLHRPDRSLTARVCTTTAWVACVLCFRGRQRQVWGNSYTELFFHDEAVALAAGHRPCAECRRADYRRFQAAWSAAHHEAGTAPAMNARMHADRRDGRAQRRHTAALGSLPDGAFVLAQAGPALWWGGALHPFTPAGYLAPVPADPGAAATVLTPGCTVATLRAGYRPILAGLNRIPR